MAPVKAIVQNVKCVPTIGPVRGDFSVKPRSLGPRGLSFQYRGYAISVEGDVQVRLHDTSDRPLCDLEFMQFVTPKFFDQTFHRDGEGWMTRSWKPGITGVVHLDGHLDLTTGAQKNAPFMSLRKGVTTRGGHFENDMQDSPEGLAPEYHVSSSGEKLWFWRLSRFDEFMTFLVFIHPTKERQPIAMVRWSFSMEYVVRWEGGEPRPLTAKLEPKPEGAIVKDDATLSSYLGIINTPPAWIMAVANDPANFEKSPVDGMRHVALPPNFFVP